MLNFRGIGGLVVAWAVLSIATTRAGAQSTTTPYIISDAVDANQLPAEFQQILSSLNRTTLEHYYNYTNVRISPMVLAKRLTEMSNAVRTITKMKLTRVYSPSIWEKLRTSILSYGKMVNTTNMCIQSHMDASAGGVGRVNIALLQYGLALCSMALRDDHEFNAAINAAYKELNAATGTDAENYRSTIEALRAMDLKTSQPSLAAFRAIIPRNFPNLVSRFTQRYEEYVNSGSTTNNGGGGIDGNTIGGNYDPFLSWP